MPKSSAWYKRGNTVLIPPFAPGRGADELRWDMAFPDAPKRSYETEEEYQVRKRLAREECAKFTNE